MDPCFVAFAWVEKTKKNIFFLPKNGRLKEPVQQTAKWNFVSNGMYFSNQKFVYKSKTGK